MARGVCTLIRHSLTAFLLFIHYVVAIVINCVIVFVKTAVLFSHFRYIRMEYCQTFRYFDGSAIEPVHTRSLFITHTTLHDYHYYTVGG